MMNHWLLNTAAEFAVPLTNIFPEPGRGLNLKPIPRCHSDHYAKGMLELFDSGQIAFSSKVLGDDTLTRNGVVRILDRFRALSAKDPLLRGEDELLPGNRLTRIPGMQVYFKLTTLGGEEWERVAQPNWTRYVSWSTVFPKFPTMMPAEGELVSADRDRILAYMGWYPQLRGEQILLETVTWQKHTDFEIVYWKRLPFVYHASFTVQPVQERWAGGAPQWFEDWRVASQSWYTQPWHLAGWPSE